MNKPEALVFADDRPTSTSDDLYQWAIDAEDLIRAQQERIAQLESEVHAERRHQGIRNVSAVRTLHALGYSWRGTDAWQPPVEQNLQQDAARYQTLVKSGNFTPSSFDNGLWGLRVSSARATKAELDEAVDRVIAAQAKQGG